MKTVPPHSIGTDQIRCTLPLTGLSHGLYNLTVTNTDGSPATSQTPLEVMNPAPAITALSQVTGYNTKTIRIVITGSDFVSGCTVALINGSSAIPGIIYSFKATKFTGIFNLSGFPTGSYNLTVSNPSDANGTKVNAFTVMNPGTAAVITSINPASGFNTGDLPVTIMGYNFRTPKVFLNQGVLLKLAKNTTGKKPTATTLSVTLPLKGVPGGLYNITVCNSDGSNATAEGIFYVTDQAWFSSSQPKSRSSSPVQIPSVQASGMKPSPDVLHAGRQVIGRSNGTS